MWVSVPGGRVWYRIVGDGPGIPLLILHGGPGAGSVSMAPLQSLSIDRPVIFYDQLGCGRSDIPRDPSLWRIERFVEEIDAVRRHLRLDEVHLLGHSWGGMLAIDYLLQRPSGVRSVVLSNCMASMRGYLDEAWRLAAHMPRWPRGVLLRHVPPQRLWTPTYQIALMWFRLRHMVRLEWRPQLGPILKSLGAMLLSPSFWQMWGPDDLHVTGNLADWERADRLHEIDTPALVMAAEHDVVTPRLARALADGLPNASLHVVDGASHMAFFERPKPYLDAVRAFLSSAGIPDAALSAPD